MTVTTIITRNPVRRPRPELPSHRFAVGQMVRVKNMFGSPARTVELYRVTKTLPPVGGSLQYRVRSEDERHERVTTEDSLEAIGASTQDKQATLIERTFSNGQGTETQQS